MQQNTHLSMSAALCGTPLSIERGEALVELKTSEPMQADAHGLVHGGFVFGLADYAAMLAINELNVVLGSADVRLLAPVRCGETLRAHAKLTGVEGKKHLVAVEVTRVAEPAAHKPVLRGSFVCFIPSVHVLAETAGEGA